MKHFHVLAQGIDTNPLVLALAQHSDLWEADTYLRKYPQGPFGDTQTIMLRFPKVEELTEDQIPVYQAGQLAGYDPHESIPRPAYSILHEARPIVMNLMTRVQGERLGRVLINKIRPGGRIVAHVDAPEQTSYYRRYHVVLQGLPGAVLRCGEEKLNMLTGAAFWFDNSVDHEVVNNSADDRISLVIDIRSAR